MPTGGDCCERWTVSTTSGTTGDCRRWSRSPTATRSSAACASTVAKLDPSITVAKTGENTLLLNLPRNIEEIDKATEDKSLLSRITRFFA